MEANKCMAGKTAVITGATSGIGLATATALAGCGAFVIGVGRSAEKCEQAVKNIMEKYPESDVRFLVCDLSSLKQVRQLAEEIDMTVGNSGRESIEVLINNAGAVSSWFVSTAEGFELQFALNHLSPFLLTHELMPLLKAADTARIITTSSGSHCHTRIRWDDIQHRKHYNCLLAYKQAKLCNILFTAELNRRLGNTSSIRAFAVDPGLVKTNIGIKSTGGIEKWVWARRSKKGISPEEAARTFVFLCTDPACTDTGNIYWKECRPLEPSKYSQREDVAKRLWEISEKMCGIKQCLCRTIPESVD